MRFSIRFLLVIAVLGAIVAVSYGPATRYWAERNRPKYRTATVQRGSITSVVNSTGEVRPVQAVSVGAFVSGPVLQIHADFNQRVKEGELLAEIDPRIHLAMVASDKASLANRQAEVERVRALLEQAIKQEDRAIELQKEGEGFVSPAEMDQVHFSRLSLEAQLRVAEAAVAQATAALENSTANLGYTKILAPVDGIIIDRKIDPGQTLAAQFQTPELFKIAPKMEERMQIHASVDEADIGLIREAQQNNRPVTFTVDAYPTELFEGKIEQIRFSSTMTQNVVTYPVVVSAANPELKLLPGMTADLSFEIESKTDVLKVPNAALRFYPKVEQVRPEDRKLLDGSVAANEPNENSTPSAAEQSAAASRRRERHVWEVAGAFLQAIPVTTGISDSQYTEIVVGNLLPDQRLVTSEATQ